MTSEEAERKRKLVEDDQNDFVALSLIRGYRPRQQPPRELTPFQRMFSSQPQPRLSLFLPEPPQQQPPPPPQPFQPALLVPIPPQPLPMINPQPPQDDHAPPRNPSSSARSVRSRRTAREGKSETIPVPFRWATDRRATIHSLQYLLENQIFTVTGAVLCKRCEKKFEMAFDLKDKFTQVWNFLAENKSTMHDRAPSVWMNPVLPRCEHCGQENSVKPIIAEKKKSINWLFLLLGQMLGCCTLEQLKYFCKHTKNHRTGAKDRVLYLTYLCLCKQLDPSGPFDR